MDGAPTSGKIDGRELETQRARQGHRVPTQLQVFSSLRKVAKLPVDDDHAVAVDSVDIVRPAHFCGTKARVVPPASVTDDSTHVRCDVPGQPRLGEPLRHVRKRHGQRLGDVALDDAQFKRSVVRRSGVGVNGAIITPRQREC